MLFICGQLQTNICLFRWPFRQEQWWELGWRNSSWTLWLSHQQLTSITPWVGNVTHWQTLSLQFLKKKCWTPSIIIHFLMMHYTFVNCVICCCYFCLIMYCQCVCLPVFACMPLWPDIQIFCLIGEFTNTVRCLMFCLYMCEGLCGTYDGNRDNDLLQNNGQVYEGRGLRPDPFSLSWR